MTATDLQVMDLSRQDVQVHAAIDVSGTTAAPVLTGRVVVDEAIYRMPERRNKDVIDLDEAVIYVDIPGVTRPDEAIERSPSLWDRSRLDIEIEVTDDAILSSEQHARGDLRRPVPIQAAAEPDADLVRYAPGAARLLRGVRQAVHDRGRGGLLLWDAGAEPGPPHRRPRTPSRGCRGRGRAGPDHGRGNAQNPTIDLTSTPPYEKSEIIALALFGTPTPSAGQQGQFTETVRDLVTGTAASSILRNTLTSELNLDVFEISQRQLEEGDSATLFRVGKFVSPDVFVSFEQQVGGQEDHQAVGIRYQMTDLFSVEATVGSRESGVDLFWEFTY